MIREWLLSVPVPPFFSDIGSVLNGAILESKLKGPSLPARSTDPPRLQVRILQKDGRLGWPKQRI